MYSSLLLVVGTARLKVAEMFDVDCDVSTVSMGVCGTLLLDTTGAA